MTKSKSIRIAGKRYESIRGAADAFEVGYGLLYRRLKYGWTPEQAAGIEPPPERRGNRSKAITIAGNNFPSAKAAAEHYGIDAKAFRARLQRGDSVERAAGITERTRSSSAVKTVFVAGKEYPSIKEACAVHGAKPSVFSKRIGRGWTPEQAAGFEPPPKRTGKPVRIETIEGTDYPGADAGEYLLYLITNTINEKEYVGITTNRLELRFNGHKSEARKINPANPLHRAMRKHGAKNFAVELLRNDASNYVQLMEQEILEIEKRDTLRHGYNATFGGEIPANAIQVEVEGKTYPTLTSAAKAYGIHPGVVQMRLQKLGWGIEEALELNRSVAKEKQVVAGGVVYGSLKKAAEMLGKPYKTVHARVTRHGWTPEQALGVLPPPSEAKSVPKRIRVGDLEFSSQAVAAKHFGLSPSLVSTRIRKLGMSIQEALTTSKTR